MTKPTRTQVEAVAREMFEAAGWPVSWKITFFKSEFRKLARWHLARVAEGDIALITILSDEIVSLQKQLAAKSPATKAKKGRAGK